MGIANFTKIITENKDLEKLQSILATIFQKLNRLPFMDGTSGQVAKSTGADGFEWGQVEADGIADGAVTTAKLADNGVTNAKVADGLYLYKIANLPSASIAESVDVTGLSRLSFNNSGLSITEFTGGYEGQMISVYGSQSSATVTFVNNAASGSGTPFLLPGGQDYKLYGGYGGALFFKSGSFWIMISATPYIRRQDLATTWTFNGSGGTSASSTVVVHRVDRVVTVTIQLPRATTGTGSTEFLCNDALPTWARPGNSFCVIGVLVRNNNSTDGANIGRLNVNASGVMSLNRSVGATAWTNSANAGFQNYFSFSYYGPES